MTIDAHVHVWTVDPTHYPWQPLLGYVPTDPFDAATLLDQMDAHGIDQAVIVQPSVYGWDHRYVLSVIAMQPERFALVALLDPTSSEWRENLESLVSAGIAGVRFNLIAAESASWITNSAYRDLWHTLANQSLPVCMQVNRFQLEPVHRLAEEVPGLTIVIDHLGKLDLSESSDRWTRLLELAAEPNVMVKLSGFRVLGHDWSELPRLMTSCVEAFGPDRLMWGSDSPGALKIHSYQQTLEPILTLDLEPKERELILDDTARKIFKLPKVSDAYTPRCEEPDFHDHV